MTDFRALCEELVEELEVWIGYGDEADCADAHAMVDRARAALAQPEPLAPAITPVGPTDEELVKHYDRAVTSAIAIRVAVRKLTMDDRDAATVVGLRAVLARWGQPATPIPVAERLPGPEDCDADGRCWWGILQAVT
jgi:hypothetical protein